MTQVHILASNLGKKVSTNLGAIQGDDGVPMADICRKAGISLETYSIGAKNLQVFYPTRCAV